ncbi:MAG: hypothetical protein AAFR62_22060 [Cyanobacteria bacterium J06629_2]
MTSNPFLAHFPHFFSVSEGGSESRLSTLTWGVVMAPPGKCSVGVADSGYAKVMKRTELNIEPVTTDKFSWYSNPKIREAIGLNSSAAV